MQYNKARACEANKEEKRQTLRQKRSQLHMYKRMHIYSVNLLWIQMMLLQYYHSSVGLMHIREPKMIILVGL